MAAKDLEVDIFVALSGHFQTDAHAQVGQGLLRDPLMGEDQDFENGGFLLFSCLPSRVR